MMARMETPRTDVAVTKSSRFLCPSSFISLRGLANRTRRTLWIALVLAVVCHILLMQWLDIREESEAVKPLTTRFIKREPRLTKPLELKKRPRPKRRPMQRRTISVKARVSLRQTASDISAGRVLRSLTAPRARVGRSVGFGGSELEPEVLAKEVMGVKEAEHVVDMSLEMLDVEALDTGKYQALVIQNPEDKRDIRGFLHLGYAYTEAAGARYTIVQGLRVLVESMNEFTGVRTDFAGAFTYDSDMIFSTPWVYAYRVGTPYGLMPAHEENLGRYLAAGGCLFLDGGVPNASYNVVQQRMVKRSLAAQGWRFNKDWTFEPLPNSHWLYHCYFDFDGPPVAGDSSWFSGAGDPYYGEIGKVYGVRIGDRVWVVYSEKGGYISAWRGSYFTGPGAARRKANIRHRQFGVNLIVFALTQEGSITNRVTDMVRY